MATKQYDFIIAGGGAAGLSLAYHLIHSPLRNRSILIVDKSAKDRNDRTWGFWTDQPLLFDPIVYRSWGKLHFAGDGVEKMIDLQEYCYKMIRGIDFYRFTRQKLAAAGNVDFLQGVVEQITEDGDGAQGVVDGRSLRGKWVFDSVIRPSAFQPQCDDYHYLKLHFKGWVIETPEAVFNPEAVTLLDFRTPQEGETRFFYVLPFSRKRALVEYTLFSKGCYSHSQFEKVLQTYLRDVVGLAAGAYRIVEKESGTIPITDRPFPRRTAKHVMTIGAKAGRIKCTTGYAFLRIQQDSAAIVQSLLKHGHPFDVTADPRFYRLLDTVMLHVMAHHGDKIRPTFTAMFNNNPIERIFRFLDEEASAAEMLLLMASMPFRSLYLRVLLQPQTAFWQRLQRV